MKKKLTKTEARSADSNRMNARILMVSTAVSVVLGMAGVAYFAA